jgi:hypothetical protein
VPHTEFNDRCRRRVTTATPFCFRDGCKEKDPFEQPHFETARRGDQATATSRAQRDTVFEGNFAWRITFLSAGYFANYKQHALLQGLDAGKCRLWLLGDCRRLDVGLFGATLLRLGACSARQSYDRVMLRRELIVYCMLKLISKGGFVCLAFAWCRGLARPTLNAVQSTGFCRRVQDA